MIVLSELSQSVFVVKCFRFVKKSRKQVSTIFANNIRGLAKNELSFFRLFSRISFSSVSRF